MSKWFTAWGAPVHDPRIPKLRVRLEVNAIGPVDPPSNPSSDASADADPVSRFSTSTAPSNDSTPPTPFDHAERGSSKRSGKGPKKRAKWIDFFAIKEPSTTAFNQYAFHQHKELGSQPRDAVSPGFSQQSLPDFVPKVNSKWDGLPFVAHETVDMNSSKKQSDLLRRSRSAHGPSTKPSIVPSRQGSQRASSRSTALPSRNVTSRNSMDRRFGHERPNGHLNLIVPVSSFPTIPSATDASGRHVSRVKDDVIHNISTDPPRDVRTAIEIPAQTPGRQARAITSSRNDQSSETQNCATLETTHKGEFELFPTGSRLRLQQDSLIEDTTTSTTAPHHVSHLSRRLPGAHLTAADPSGRSKPSNGSRSSSRIQNGSDPEISLDPGVAVTHVSAQPTSKPRSTSVRLPGLPPASRNIPVASPSPSGTFDKNSSVAAGPSESESPRTNEDLLGPRPAVPSKSSIGSKGSVPVPRNFAKPLNAPTSHADSRKLHEKPRNFARPFAPKMEGSKPKAVHTTHFNGASVDSSSVAGPVTVPNFKIGRPVTKDTALEPIMEVDGASIISDQEERAPPRPGSRPIIERVFECHEKAESESHRLSTKDDEDVKVQYSRKSIPEPRPHIVLPANVPLSTPENDDSQSLSESVASTMSESWYRSPKERLGLGSVLKHDRKGLDSGLLAEPRNEGFEPGTKQRNRGSRGSSGSIGSLAGMFRR